MHADVKGQKRGRCAAILADQPTQTITPSEVAAGAQGWLRCSAQATNECGSRIDRRTSDLVPMHDCLHFLVAQGKELHGRSRSWTPHTV